MAMAKQKANWEAVSALLAMTHNVHCTRKSQQQNPERFNPFRNRRKRLSPKQSVDALISAFVKKRT
jgi:hypothetical protein